MKDTHARRGIGSIEVIVGVTIAALVLLFAGNAIVLFMSTGRDTAEKTQALYLAEEALEMVKYIRDERWEHIDTLTDGATYYLDITPSGIATSTSPEVIEGFTRSFSVEPVERDGSDDIVQSGTPDPGAKYVTATVSWGTPTTSVSLTTIVADLQEP